MIQIKPGFIYLLCPGCKATIQFRLDQLAELAIGRMDHPKLLGGCGYIGEIVPPETETVANTPVITDEAFLHDIGVRLE